MKKIKVIMIGALPPPHIGPNIATLRLYESFQPNDVLDINFFDISDKRNANTMGRFDFGNISLGAIHFMKFMYRTIVYRPNVVYLGMSQGLGGWLRDLFFIVPTLLCKRKVVLHLRGSEFRIFYESMNCIFKSLTKWSLRKTSRVIVLGENLKDIFENLVEPNRIKVISNGISLEAFDRVLAPDRELPKIPKLLFLASLRERKGIHLLLESLALVVKVYPEIMVTIAGVWRSEQDKRTAEGIIKKHGLESVCDFIGLVSGEEKIKLYISNDIFVFPPIEPEGLPWVILEAMSANLPIVTTDQGAIREVVEDGVTGYIVDIDPVSVAEKIITLLSDKSQAQNMGVKGRIRVEELFNEKLYFKKIKDTITESVYS